MVFGGRAFALVERLEDIFDDAADGDTVADRAQWRRLPSPLSHAQAILGFLTLVHQREHAGVKGILPGQPTKREVPIDIYIMVTPRYFKAD